LADLPFGGLAVVHEQCVTHDRCLPSQCRADRDTCTEMTIEQRSDRHPAATGRQRCLCPASTFSPSSRMMALAADVAAFNDASAAFLHHFPYQAVLQR